MASDAAQKQPTWPKECSCGEKYDANDWERLPLLGIQESGSDSFPSLECRLCDSCKNTLAQIEPNDVHLAVKK